MDVSEFQTVTVSSVPDKICEKLIHVENLLRIRLPNQVTE